MENVEAAPPRKVYPGVLPNHHQLEFWNALWLILSDGNKKKMYESSKTSPRLRPRLNEWLMQVLPMVYIN